MTRIPRQERLLPIVMLLVLLPVIAPVALANGLPTAAHVSTAGGLLLPAAGIPIVLDEADIVIDAARAGATWTDATVTVTYVLRNLATGPVRLSMAFPLPPGQLPVEAEAQGAQVSWKGASLSYQRAPAPDLVAEDDLAVLREWLDPFTGASYEPRLFRQEPEPVFVSFDLLFAAGETDRLVVRYQQQPGRDYSRFVEPSLRYDYLLMPARYWPQVGRVAVTVRVPPGYAAASNLKLAATGDSRYFSRFTLLPSENLSVFVSPGKGVIPVLGLYHWRQALASYYWRQDGRLRLAVLATVVAACLSGVVLAFMRRLQVNVILSGAALYAVSALVIYPGFLGSPLFGPNPISVIATRFLMPVGLSLMYFLVLRLVYARWGERRTHSKAGGISVGMGRTHPRHHDR